MTIDDFGFKIGARETVQSIVNWHVALSALRYRQVRRYLGFSLRLRLRHHPRLNGRPSAFTIDDDFVVVYLGFEFRIYNFGFPAAGLAPLGPLISAHLEIGAPGGMYSLNQSSFRIPPISQFLTRIRY